MPTLANKKNLWKYLGLTAAVAAVCLICWYFRTILIYMAIAVVISLVGRPFKNYLCRVRIGSFRIPKWLGTLVTLALIFSLFIAVFLLLSPLVVRIAEQVASMNTDSIAIPLLNLNNWIRDTFPSLGRDFRIELIVQDQIQSLVSFGTVSVVVSSVSNILIETAVGLFSVAFMSWFFIADEGLLTNTIVSVAPDSYETHIRRTSKRTSRLLSRYFIGLIIESSFIMVLNSLGLSLVAGMEVGIALVVAILTGIFNVIPYVGPLAGELLAVMMGIVTHSTCSFSGSFGFFLFIVFLVCFITQLIDNYVFQPIIYSSSVKAHPLEIFIVILMAAKLWGILGMLVAVPGYTVLRVILSEVFPNAKIVKLLTLKMQK